MQNDNLKNQTPTDANNVLCEALPKTRKCDWCDKRKSVEQGYWLGKFENQTKDWFICVECNLKHDIV
jgi:hypothetical protein